MKIGILTTFSAWSETYSLVHIVASQIRMLQTHGYEVVLFVNEDFTGVELCETRKSIPVFTYENYSSISAVPDYLVEKLKTAFETTLHDIDVCFTHDLILQDSFLPHNLALRKVNLPIVWKHWIHSQPNGIKVGNIPQGHKVVFLNYSDRLAVAERYSTWIENVDVVYNSIEPHSVRDTDTITEKVSKIFEGKEVRVGYAFCTTRMGAKGVDKLLRLVGCIKSNGKSVGVCLMNSNANAEREKTSIKSMLELGEKYGLTSQDVVFTSTLDVSYELGVPHHVSRNIFAISNLFIFPTIAECCSLVLLEAMSAGNLLVLNGDIDSMKEFGGFDSALYMKFGSIWNKTQYGNEEGYYSDWAKIIIRQLSSDMGERARERALQFSEENVWKRQLSHLLPV